MLNRRSFVDLLATGMKAVLKGQPAASFGCRARTIE